MGTLMKKIQCQLSAWVSAPPTSRPMAPPAEATKAYDAHGPGPLPGPVKMVTRMPRMVERRQRRPRPWTNRADDELDLGVGQAAEDRRHGEQSHAGQEDLLRPDEVTHPAGQQEESAEGDQVGVDDPGQRRCGEVQVPLDRRQRDVHHRCVEHDHELADAEDHQGDPAPAVAVAPLLDDRPPRGGERLSPGAHLGWNAPRRALFPWRSGAGHFPGSRRERRTPIISW